MTGFWVGGEDAFCRGLRGELKSRLADLKRRLASTQDNAEKRQISQQIRALTDEYRLKLRRIDQSLF